MGACMIFQRLCGRKVSFTNVTLPWLVYQSMILQTFSGRKHFMAFGANAIDYRFPNVQSFFVMFTHVLTHIIVQCESLRTNGTEQRELSFRTVALPRHFVRYPWLVRRPHVPLQPLVRAKRNAARVTHETINVRMCLGHVSHQSLQRHKLFITIQTFRFGIVNVRIGLCVLLPHVPHHQLFRIEAFTARITSEQHFAWPWSGSGFRFLRLWELFVAFGWNVSRLHFMLLQMQQQIMFVAE